MHTYIGYIWYIHIVHTYIPTAHTYMDMYNPMVHAHMNTYMHTYIQILHTHIHTVHSYSHTVNTYIDTVHTYSTVRTQNYTQKASGSVLLGSVHGRVNGG